MQSIVNQIGGEEALRNLVERFYDLIESEPRGENLRRLHFRGTGIASARVEQFNFLSGFLGGRRHYFEKHGHMDIKLMHKHVPITSEDAEDWLFLMEQAVDSCGIISDLKDRLMVSFRRVALVLVNDGIVAVLE
jgi:hemoglobin